MSVHLWSKQNEIWQSTFTNPRTAVNAGHGVGKSFAAAAATVKWIKRFWTNGFVLTVTPMRYQSNMILWKYIEDIHKSWGCSGCGTISDERWTRNGGLDNFALGTTPSDFIRNQKEFEKFNTEFNLIVIDEAGHVEASFMDRLLDTFSDATILAIGTPAIIYSESVSTWFETVCVDNPKWKTVPISVFDSPNFTDEEVSADVKSKLVGADWVEDKRRTWSEDSELWESKILAQFCRYNEDVSLR